MATDHKLMAPRRNGTEDGCNKVPHSIELTSWADKGVLPVLDHALEQVELPRHGLPIVVANLGCLAGSGSLIHVDHIVKQLRARLDANARDIEGDHDDIDPPSRTQEFEVYFNLLPHNDYNVMFQITSNDSLAVSSDSQQQQPQQPQSESFFPHSVPGSFYGRLFGRSKIHVFFSSAAVHVLSRIPDAVKDRGSPAFNRGKVWLYGASDATVQAFKEQSGKDLKTFLLGRADELVSGGSLCFSTLTRTACKAYDIHGVDLDALDAYLRCLHETSLEGILTQQELDACNLPIYLPTFEEVTEVIKSHGSIYAIVAAEEVKCRPFPFLSTGAPPVTDMTDEHSRNGSDHATSTHKSILEFGQHSFGTALKRFVDKKRLNTFWNRFSEIATEKYMHSLPGTCPITVIALTKRDVQP